MTPAICTVSRIQSLSVQYKRHQLFSELSFHNDLRTEAPCMFHSVNLTGNPQYAQSNFIVTGNPHYDKLNFIWTSSSLGTFCFRLSLQQTILLDWGVLLPDELFLQMAGLYSSDIPRVGTWLPENLRVC